MGTYDGQECVFIPLHYRNKKAGLGLMADAATDPLSFDVATAVVLRFAKFGLINLQSYLVRLFAPHDDS